MSSPLVAVAGGSSGLGRSITQAIIAAGKFEVVILSRKVDEEKQKEIGARFIALDYTDIDALTKSLEENKIHTIISTLESLGTVQPELNLIAAADRSSVTKRFVPSTWSIDFEGKEEHVLPGYLPIAKGKIDVVSALKASSLEYTSWNIGYFADYYIAPHLKSDMRILRVVVDVEHNAAGIPGTGDVPVVFTYTQDVAKFVAASLALPKWEPQTFLIGDKLTWNDVVKIAEEVKGVKFDVAYDPPEKLLEGKVTELPAHREMYPFFPKEFLQGVMSSTATMFHRGLFNLQPARTVDQDFPEIKLHGMKELLTKAWAEKKE